MPQIKRKNTASKLAAAVGAVTAVMTARSWGQAVISYTTPNAAYNQSFDSLPYTPEIPNSQTQNPVTINGTVYKFPSTGTLDFSAGQNATAAGGLGLSSTMSGWYGASQYTGTTRYGFQNGSNTTGGIISFGEEDSNNGGSDNANRALGLLNTSSTSYVTFAAEIVNNTMSTLNQISINYTGELWRQSNLSKTINFSYDIATPSSVIPASSSDTTIPGFTLPSNPLDISFATNATDGGGTNVDGQTAPFQQSLGVTNAAISGWTAGTALWLIWSMPDSTGKAQGMAIDNFVFSANGAGAGGGGATNVTWNANSGAWDTTTGNWTGGSPVANLYADGDNAIFGDQSSIATVTVVGGGVAPNNTTVNIASANGGYTFTGGAIGGSGTLTINGTGTVTLNSPNTYAGGTFVSGTKLIVDGGANRLGGGSVSIGSGSVLQINTASIVSTASFTINSGGATIDTNNFNLTTTGSLSINDVFNKTGAGNLQVGTVSVPSLGVLNILQGNVILDANDTVSQGNSAVYNGNLIVLGGETMSFGGTITGTGAIQIVTSDNIGASKGVVITNTKGPAVGDIKVPIELNSTNQAFTPGNVAAPTFVPGSFTVTIGGTTAGTGFFNIDNVISGNSDVNIGNAVNGTGSGTLTINQPATYAGATTINTNAGTLINGCDNALPTTTDVIVGTQYIGLSTWNLNGMSQQIASLSSGAVGVAQANSVGTSAGYLTITNNSSNNSVLTISGSVSPANPDYDIITEGPNGGTVALTKQGTNTITLEGNANGNDNFTGGLTMQGGTLDLNMSINTGGVIDPSNSVNMSYLSSTLGIVGKSTGFSTQEVSALNLYRCNDGIDINDSGGSGTTFEVSTINRFQGGGVLFATLTPNATFTVDDGGPPLQNGIIPWATVNGTDFATMNGTSLVALPSGDYTEALLPLLVNNQSDTVKIDSSSPGTISAAPGTTQINSMLVNDTSAHTLNIGTGNTLQVGTGSGTGAIFVTASTPLFTIDSPATAGTLTAAGNELLLISNSTMLVNSNVTDGPNGSVLLTTAGTSTTILNGASSYTGDTEIEGGTLQVGNGGTTGTIAGGAAYEIDDHGTLAFNRSDNTTEIDAEIDGPGGISQIGSGSTLLTGPNTFIGTIAISNGTLAVTDIESPGSVQPLGQGTGAILLGSNATPGTLKYTENSPAELDLPLTVAGSAGGGVVNASIAALTLGGAINNTAGNFTLSGGQFIVNSQISGSSTASSVSVTNGAAVTLNNSSNSYSGGTNVANGSTLTVAAAGALPSGGAVANNGEVVVAGNTTTGDVSGYGTMIVQPGIALAAANFTQGKLFDNGSVTITGNGTVGSLGTTAITGAGSLTIGNGSTSNTVTLASGSGLSKVGSLTILGGAALDLTNDHMYISYGTNPDPVTQIRQYLSNGYNRGISAWDGGSGKPALISTAAAVTQTSTSVYALGYSDSADGGIHPPGLPADTIEVKYTLLGDLNLDGAVSGADFTELSDDFGQFDAAWDKGDLGYNGVVNGADFSALSFNFGKLDSGASIPLTPADWAAFDSFAASESGLQAAVPEPTTAGLLALGGMGLLGRRRRRKA